MPRISCSCCIKGTVTGSPDVVKCPAIGFSRRKESIDEIQNDRFRPCAAAAGYRFGQRR